MHIICSYEKQSSFSIRGQAPSWSASAPHWGLRAEPVIDLLSVFHTPTFMNSGRGMSYACRAYECYEHDVCLSVCNVGGL